MIVLNTNVSYFNNIWIEPPIERILYRLGYRKGKTVLTKEQEEEIEKLIWEALSLLYLAHFNITYSKRDERA